MHKLPFDLNLDDIDILKALSNANNKIGELNGLVKALPNPNIILNAVILGEAKESSEIENIVTTYDRIFKEITLKTKDASSKEVVNYRQAILHGFKLLNDNGFISTNMLVEIHRIIEPSVGDVRKIPGTVILNTKTNEILHTPPQNESKIREYLSNLEKYINYPELENVDPLIKMGLIHFQFESIHPFHDGNGRVGRILNILYLVLEHKINIPILYLSKYINAHKKEYYDLLNMRQKDLSNYKKYIIYMLKAVNEMSQYTINFINKMLNCIDNAKNIVIEKLPKIYSQELIDYLFYDFYTKNEYLRNNLNISRNTASKYLHSLSKIGILIEEKVGKEIIYKNSYLYDLIKTW